MSAADPRVDLQTIAEELTMMGFAFAGIEPHEWTQALAWTMQSVIDRLAARLADRTEDLGRWTPPEVLAAKAAADADFAARFAANPKDFLVLPPVGGKRRKRPTKTKATKRRKAA